MPRSRIVRRFWPSDKVNIILDTFQGCYKPKLRFFAGLYFLFRILIFVNYVARASILQQYIVQQLLCCGMIALLAIFQPYRRQLFNYVDTLFFFFQSCHPQLAEFVYTDAKYNQPRPAFPRGSLHRSVHLDISTPNVHDFIPHMVLYHPSKVQGVSDGLLRTMVPIEAARLLGSSR